MPRDADGVEHRSGGAHPPSDAGAARIAGRQLGLIHREQLLALGFSRRQIDRRLSQGRLFLIYPNVYALGHPRITPRSRLRAALMSLGSEAFLSRRTAAAALGLRPIDPRAIHITIPGTGGRHRDGLIIHRTRSEPHPSELRTTPDSLRHSSVLRMLVEVAPSETSQELGRLITLAVQKRLLRLEARDGREEVEAFLARHAGRAGTSALRRALARYRHAGNSNLEQAFTELLQRHPEIPPPSDRNLQIDIWEIDVYWAAQRVAVELDGRPYHLAAADMERDRRKDIALQRLGITPLRFTDLRLETDEGGIVGDLVSFLT